MIFIISNDTSYHIFICHDGIFLLNSEDIIGLQQLKELS